MNKKLEDNRLDWNMALSQDEDWKAAMNSEVFRNYLTAESSKDNFIVPLHLSNSTNIDQRYLDAALSEALSFPDGSKERALFMNYYRKLQAKLELQKEIDSPLKTAGDKKLEESNKKKFKKDTDTIMDKVEKAEDASKVPTPIIQNLPYDGDDYQEHVERVHDANKDGRSTYDEFFPDYKVYHKSDMENDLVKMALEDLENEIAVAPAEPATNEIGIKPEKSSGSWDKLYSELYNTGAGASQYLDIGVTNETEKLMQKGIDYMGSTSAKPASTPKPANPAAPAAPAAQAAPVVNTQPVDEIKEAEVALGLDKNIFYILRKMGK